jgi:tetratricopeptide (TPR) repeat protein/transcriptional regulator with XRE-family HTH domain
MHSPEIPPQPRIHLTEARNNRGLSQQEVADLIGSTHVNVSRWERGITRPSPYFRRKLCGLFGKTEEELDLVAVHDEGETSQEATLALASGTSSAPTVVSGREGGPVHPGALYDPAIPLPPAYPLVGRELDLARIKQRLRGVGNVALTALNGLPGVGKTALSITLAHDPELRDHFSDGVLWAGLGPNPNMPGLLSRWGSLLGISQAQMATLSGNEAWARAIRTAIGTRKMLLVIDDAWQLEEALTVRVGGPNCAHLVTTRFPAIAAHMAVGGATMIQELNVEESLQLLDRLAPQVVSREAQRAQDLVQAVGGLPLALTLLGNYLRKQAYSGPARRITAAMQRLSDAQVRLQISEPHVPVESHPSLPIETSLSLQSVIAVTDQLLPEPAQLALYTLAVFPPKPNTFSEEAALAVTASTIDELDALSDAGLLESNGERYTLHQVIADYAHLRLSDLEAHKAHSRLIAYITDYVETHKKDYELLQLESNTIRTTLDLAYEQDEQPELVHVACDFAPFLILRGFYPDAEHHLKRAHDAAVQLDDKEGTIGTLLYLGEIEQRQGNYPQAEAHLQQGLTLARQVNNNERVCALLTQLGIVFQEQGNFPQAEAAYQEGLALARNNADQISICTLLDNLGWLNVKCGEFARSESYLQEGLALARKIADRERVGGLLRRLGALELYRGNFVQAQSYLQEGLNIARQLGDSEQICALLGNLGVAASRQGKISQAKLYYQEGLEIARQIGHRERICGALINLGDVFIKEDNYVQGEICFQEGLELARQIGHREWISGLLLNLGMTARKQGHYSDAKPYLEEGLALANQISQSYIFCAILCELGDISISEGNTGLADDYFRKMLEQLPSGDQQLLALAYYGLARVYALQGDRENARLHGDKSVTLFETMGHRQAEEVREWMKSALD